jgi:hypothetical protein
MEPKREAGKEAGGLGRRRQELVARLAGCPSLIKASLVVNRRKCGNPACRCAEGKLHESLAFTFKERGRSVIAHVPRGMEDDARRAERDYKALKKAVDALSALNLKSFRLLAEREKERRRR